MCVVNAAMRMRNIKTDREIRSELPNHVASSIWLFSNIRNCIFLWKRTSKYDVLPFMNNLENIKNETSIETNNFANWNPDVRQQFLSKRTPKNHRVCYISYTEERKTWWVRFQEFNLFFNIIWFCRLHMFACIVLQAYSLSEQ